ncbi:MAG: ABC transporter permease [Deltaproteobacteria bacterium]|nr:ABC transporter permease [Deltaproteobacteria bacterium]
MILPLLRWLSLRHWLQHPVRAGLTLTGVALGVAVTIAVDLLAGEILAANRRSLEAIAGKAQLTVTAGESGLDRVVADRIFGTPGVAHVDALLERQLIEPGRGPILLLGVDFLADAALRQIEAEGADQEVIDDPIAFLNSRSAAVVPESFATRRGLKKGDRFTLTAADGAHELEIRAVVKDRGPARAFGGDVVIMYLDAAQVALGMDDRVSRVDVGLAADAQPETVKAALEAELGPAFVVDFPLRRGARLDQMMTGLEQALFTMAALAIWVGILLAYNAIEISVRQRKNELAILRAIGTSRRAVIALVLAEAAGVGLVATALGLGLGYLFATYGLAATATTVSDVYDVVKVSEVQLLPRHVVTGLGVGLLIPLLGALRPARHVANESPVAGLTRGVEETFAAGRPWKPLVFGGLFFVAGLSLAWSPAAHTNIAVGYGAFASMLGGSVFFAPVIVSGLAQVLRRACGRRLWAEHVVALDHVVRDRRRAALNVASLVAGVATVITVATYATSFKEANQRWLASAVPADVFVTSGSKMAMTHNTPLDPALGQELGRIDGVDEVFLVRIADFDFRGRPLKLISTQMRGYEARSTPLVVEGAVSRDGPVARGAGVFVSENLAGRDNFHPGDRLTLPTPSGPATFEVEAVVVDFTSDQGVLLIDRAPYVKLFADPLVDSFELFLKPGVDPAAVQQQIRRQWGAKYDLFVLTNREFKAEAQELIEQIFALLDLLQLLTLFIAVLGVGTTLIAAVLDRTQEVGVMRAVGTTPLQVIHIVLSEAGFIGAAAAFFGTLQGALCGMVFLRTILLASIGWRLPWVLPESTYVFVFLGVSAASVVAGLYPAWWSAKQPTLEALQAE